MQQARLWVWDEYEFLLYGRWRIAYWRFSSISCEIKTSSSLRFKWSLHSRQDPCEFTDVPRNRRRVGVPFWLHLITVLGLSAAVYKCEASKVNTEQGEARETDSSPLSQLRRQMNDNHKLKANTWWRKSQHLRRSRCGRRTPAGLKTFCQTSGSLAAFSAFV